LNKAQKARLTALQRIQTYLNDNAAQLGSVSKSTSRTDLDTAVTGLVQYVAQQSNAETTALSAKSVKDAAREDLRMHHMQPIAAIAKKKLTGTPNIQKLALPHKNTSDIDLVGDGTAMAEAAAQYTQVFLDQQLPADFIAQLQAAVQAVQDAVNAQQSARLRVNDATKSVKAQLAVTSTDVKVLNSLVTKQLKGQTGLLGAWKNAKRVHIVAVANPATPVVPATPAPTPVSGPTTVPVPAPTPIIPVAAAALEVPQHVTA
jgi:hypothetical protein